MRSVVPTEASQLFSRLWLFLSDFAASPHAELIWEKKKSVNHVVRGSSLVLLRNEEWLVKKQMQTDEDADFGEVIPDIWLFRDIHLILFFSYAHQHLLEPCTLRHILSFISSDLFIPFRKTFPSPAARSIFSSPVTQSYSSLQQFHLLRWRQLNFFYKSFYHPACSTYTDPYLLTLFLTWVVQTNLHEPPNAIKFIV